MKTLFKMIKPVLEQTSLSDRDLLASLNAIHDAMVENPSCRNPPVNDVDFKTAIDRYTAAASAVPYGGEVAILERNKCRADALDMLRMFVDTVATSSTVQTGSPSLRLPPLVCSNKDGKRYFRPSHIQDEIRRILPLARADCISQAKSLQNETLVFFIRVTHESDDELCARFVTELSKRVRHRARRRCRAEASRLGRKLDHYDLDMLVSTIEMQVLELVLTKERVSEAEFLEVAFGQTVQRIARDEFEKFNNSTAGHIVDLVVDSSDEDWDGEAAERPIEFVPDGSTPEGSLLHLDMRKSRHRLLRLALKAVENPRHGKAAILHWAHGVPVDSCQRGRKCLTKLFRKDARQIRHWLDTAMQQMRDALGITKSRETGKPAACLSALIGAAGFNH